jgi:hypothetical protein
MSKTSVSSSYNLPRRIFYRTIATNLLFVAIILSFSFTIPVECVRALNCPVEPVQGFQPKPSNIAPTFDRAGFNKLGSSGPTLPNIIYGLGSSATTRKAYAPCVLLKAMGWIESEGWFQFNTNNTYQTTGPTVIASDCGYGIMQITSGMTGGGGFDPQRVASSINYNIGTGTKILIEKWNSNIPPVGNNNPEFIEHWYYAIWAYNGFSFDNNPNNPIFPANRSSWSCTKQNASQWPYQEKVLGCVQFPPDDPEAIVEPGDPRVVLWNSVTVSFPPRSSIAAIPGAIESPSPRHGSCIQIYLPMLHR